MSFDTDYLNSQKEKLNESISNSIRFDLPKHLSIKINVAVASKLSKNLNHMGIWKTSNTKGFADDKTMNLQALNASSYE